MSTPGIWKKTRGTSPEEEHLADLAEGSCIQLIQVHAARHSAGGEIDVMFACLHLLPNNRGYVAAKDVIYPQHNLRADRE